MSNKDDTFCRGKFSGGVIIFLFFGGGLYSGKLQCQGNQWDSA
jgi:hypothetical protein